MNIHQDQLVAVPLAETELFRFSDIDSIPVPVLLENLHPTNTLTLKWQQSPTGASGSFIDIGPLPAFTLAPAAAPGSVAMITLSGLNQFVRLLGSGGANGAVGKELLVGTMRRKNFNANMSVLTV